MAHRWTEAIDYFAVLLYMEGCFNSSAIAAYSKRYDNSLINRGLEIGSLAMRVSNVKAIDTGKGLENYAKQTCRVFEYCSGLSLLEIKKGRKFKNAKCSFRI